MPTGKKANQSLYGTEGSAARRTESSRVDGGELVSRVLESQKVKYLFTINGGHIWPILAHLREHDVQMIHMRHEQVVRLRRRRLCPHDRHARRAAASPPAAVSRTRSPVSASPGSPAARSSASPASIRRRRTSSAPSRKRTARRSAGRSRSSPSGCSTGRRSRSTCAWRFARRRRRRQAPSLLEIPTNVLYQQDDVAEAAPRRAHLSARRAARRGRSRGDRPRARAARAARAPADRRRRRHLLVGRRPPSCASSPSSRGSRSTRAAPGRARCPRTIRWRSAAPGRSRSPAAPTSSWRSASASGAASTSASRRRGATTRTYIQVDADAVAHRLARAGRGRRSSAIRSSCSRSSRRARSGSASTRQAARRLAWLARGRRRARHTSSEALDADRAEDARRRCRSIPTA